MLTNRVTSLRCLRLVLGALGVIPILSASVTILGGAEALPGGGPVPATVDSDLRFFAVFWLAAGVAVFAMIPTIERRRRELTVLALAVTAGGLARIISIAQTGRPHPLAVVSLAVELLAPPTLLIWQRRVERATCTGTTCRGPTELEMTGPNAPDRDAPWH